MEKFSSKMDAEVLAKLKEHARSTGRTVASILTEAVETYFDRKDVRPAFHAALDEVLDEHEELLKRLAR